MNNENVAKVIKKIRTDNNLTQKDFADKLGVTFQAVSKWENSKNIPDIAILNQISDEFNIDLKSIINGEFNQKKRSNNIFKIILFLILSLIVIVLGVLYLLKNDEMNLRVLSTNSEDFSVNGCVVFNNNNSSIYIDGLNYSGNDNEVVFEKIMVTLYEKNDDKLVAIDNHIVNNENKEVFEKIIENITFNVTNYSATCKSFETSDLYIEAVAVNENGKTTNYQIPFTFTDSCVCEN